MEELHLVQGEHGMELPREEENWVLLRQHGYSPVQSLAAAAGACGAYVYQDILKNSKVPYVFHGVDISYSRNEEKQGQPLKELTIQFQVTIEEEFRGRAERGLRLVSRYCPVIQSLDSAITITETVLFV